VPSSSARSDDQGEVVGVPLARRVLAGYSLSGRQIDRRPSRASPRKCLQISSVCGPTAGLKFKITKMLRFQRPEPKGAARAHILIDEWQGEH